MDWWVIVAYVALLLFLLTALSSMHVSAVDLRSHACALVGDAVAILGYNSIPSSCPYSGEYVGDVPLAGCVSIAGVIIVGEEC